MNLTKFIKLATLICIFYHNPAACASSQLNQEREREQELSQAVTILEGIVLALPELPLYDINNKISYHIPEGAAKDTPTLSLNHPSALAAIRLTMTSFELQIRKRLLNQIKQAQFSYEIQALFDPILIELKKINNLTFTAPIREELLREEITAINSHFTKARALAFTNLTNLKNDLAKAQKNLDLYMKAADTTLIKQQVEKFVDQTKLLEKVNEDLAQTKASLNEIQGALKAKEIELAARSKEEADLKIANAYLSLTIRQTIQETFKSQQIIETNAMSRVVKIHTATQNIVEVKIAKNLQRFLDSVLQGFQLQELGNGLEHKLILTGSVQSIDHHGNAFKGYRYTLHTLLDFKAINYVKEVSFSQFRLSLPFNSLFHLDRNQAKKEIDQLIDGMRSIISRSEQGLEEQEKALEEGLKASKESLLKIFEERA